MFDCLINTEIFRNIQLQQLKKLSKVISTSTEVYLESCQISMLEPGAYFLKIVKNAAQKMKFFIKDFFIFCAVHLFAKNDKKLHHRCLTGFQIQFFCVTLQKQSPRCFLQKRYSQKYRKVHRKTSVPESILIKLKTCNFIKIETMAQVFSCEFCEIYGKTFSYRTPPVTASNIINVFNCLDLHFFLAYLEMELCNSLKI